MSIIVDGDLREALPLGSASVSYPIKNFTGLRVYTQDYVTLSTTIPLPPLGEKHHIYNNAVLAEQGEAQTTGAIARFTRKYVEFPQETLSLKRKDNDKGYDFEETIYEFGLDPINYHYSEPTQLTYTYPAYHAYDTWWFDEGGSDSEEYVKFAKRMGREALTVGVMGLTTHRYINLMDNAYATYKSGQEEEITNTSNIYYNGQLYKPYIIHENGDVTIRVGTNLVKLTPNTLRVFHASPSGFDISKIPIRDKWSPRKLHASLKLVGDEYEVEPIDTTYKIKHVAPRWTKPTLEEYKQGVSAGIYVRAESTKVEQVMGVIYVIKEFLVPLK